jgi:hypothetical protein
MTKEVARKATSTLVELTEAQTDQIAGGQEAEAPGFGRFTAFTTENTPIGGPAPANPPSGVQPSEGRSTAFSAGGAGGTPL